MKNALRLIRDILIASGLYFGGSLWFTLVWPRMDAAIGLLMVVGSVGGFARINVKPFSYIDIHDLFRSYFPKNITASECRRVAWAFYRLGFILSILPGIFYIPILGIVKESEKIHGYIYIYMCLFLIGIFFLYRGGWLHIRDIFNKHYFKK